MAIYYYAEGEHPFFVGWRFVSTEGDNSSMVQKYWNIKNYSYEEGKRLAEEEEAKVKAIAKLKKNIRRITGNKVSRKTLHLRIASGCMLKVHKYTRSGKQRYDLNDELKTALMLLKPDKLAVAGYINSTFDRYGIKDNKTKQHLLNKL